MTPLNISIISRSPTCYSTNRLFEECKKRNHNISIINPLLCGMFVEEKAPSITYNQSTLTTPDAIIPRIGASVTFYGAAVVRQFEQMGTWSLNPSQSIIISRDKLRSLQILSRYDIGIASSAFVRSRKDILPAIEKVGGTPIIIKLLEGTQGVGVILAENLKIAEAIIETLQSKSHNVLIQKFVKESKGKDIRAFVVGNKVVAAMRRTAVGQEFRSNVHRGGKTQAITLSPDYEKTAIRAAQILGLRVAGVDMLESNEGPVIMEVNSSPGLEGIEGCTKINVAGSIIDYVEDNVQFDEPDLKQRLSLNHGFQVAEITITENSPFAHKSIRETDIREKDIIILSITRSKQVTAAPKGDDVLLPGDIVLCYGRKQTIREFMLS